ncbi:MAG: PQQ-binding-like beta-propeller repeat protein [Planctomycetota bacterium]
MSTSCVVGQSSIERGWRDWAGPNNDFSISSDTSADFAQRPNLVWERVVGKGHSAVVIDGKYCFCQFSKGKTEYVQKLDLMSGDVVWEFDYPVGIQSQRYPGPHATPAISKNCLVVASIDGQIHSIDIDSGAERWRVDLRKTFGTKLPQSGYAASPLIYQDMVLVPTLGESQAAETETRKQPGGNAPPGIVSLSLESGNTVWQSSSFRSSHASPIIVRMDQKPLVCLHGMFELIALQPSDGRIVWQHQLRREAADNVSFTPLWDEERSQLIVSHGYCTKGTQAIGVKVNRGQWTTKLNWSNRDMRIVHTNAVLVGATLVGTNRDPSTVLVGVDVQNGETKFKRRGFGKTNLIRIGKQVVALDDRGVLFGGLVTDQGIKKTWSIDVSEQQLWTVPSATENQLLIRAGEKLRLFRFGSRERE